MDTCLVGWFSRRLATTSPTALPVRKLDEKCKHVLTGRCRDILHTQITSGNWAGSDYPTAPSHKSANSRWTVSRVLHFLTWRLHGAAGVWNDYSSTEHTTPCQSRIFHGTRGKYSMTVQFMFEILPSRSVHTQSIYIVQYISHLPPIPCRCSTWEVSV